MSDTNGQPNSSKTWSRRKIAILIVGILFIFMLVVILGYVFVTMSSEDDSYVTTVMTTAPSVLSNDTTVSPDIN